MSPTTLELIDDALLLGQLQEDNTDAFTSLYKKYWQKVYSDAYKCLKDQHLAKDIVQEIFTYLWLKRDTIEIDNLPAYLKVAVRNRVFKQIAKQKKTHPFFSFLDATPAPFAKADNNLLWKEFIKLYDELLLTLPSKRQFIFRLRFQEDLSTIDIAQKLRLSRKTVQNQLGKAIEQLRVSLQGLTLLLTLFTKIFENQ